jgi:hypothetical protein
MIDHGQVIQHHQQTLRKTVGALLAGTDAFVHLQYGGFKNTTISKDKHGQKTLQTILVMPNHPVLLPY